MMVVDFKRALWTFAAVAMLMGTLAACEDTNSSDDSDFGDPPPGATSKPESVFTATQVTVERPTATEVPAPSEQQPGGVIEVRPAASPGSDIDAGHPVIEGTFPEWALNGGPYPARTDAELAEFIDDSVALMNESWFDYHLLSGFTEAQQPFALLFGFEGWDTAARPWREGSAPCGSGDSPNYYCRPTQTIDWQVEEYHKRNRQGGFGFVFRSLAHEFGHHIQYLSGSSLPQGSEARELQAECLAGGLVDMHIGWVYDELMEFESTLTTRSGFSLEDWLHALEIGYWEHANVTDIDGPNALGGLTVCLDEYGY